MKKKSCVLVWLLMLTCLLTGCIQLPPEGENPSDTAESNSQMNHPFQHFYPDAVYVYQSDVDVDLLLTGFDPAYLLLANKTNVLGRDYVPSSLKTLTLPYTKKTGLQLESRTADALCAMMEEMRADGVLVVDKDTGGPNVWVTSGYRDYSYQQSLYNTYYQYELTHLSEDAIYYFGDAYIQTHYRDKGLTGLNPDDARKVVLSYSALPGTSEHQTGLCVDFITDSMSGLTNAFANTAAFSWLSENAYKFGFILRYPSDKVDVTGYSYESWHYRFVGREAATDMYFAKLTLEEYLVALNEKNDITEE
ncbi:MAG: D-alanyl-D-alanine carboxypeptidase family protein [Ruminococcaceae bacterium]|nr:D-alanyl-D-alanine carboxypeptidase family protein [Oscillospiraceae bacterium]